MTELVKLIVGYLYHQLKRQSRLVVMIRQSPLWCSHGLER